MAGVDRDMAQGMLGFVSGCMVAFAYHNMARIFLVTRMEHGVRGLS